MKQANSLDKTGDGPGMGVADAWDEAFPIARGLYNLLSIGVESDEGLTPEGCRALTRTAEHLIGQMEIVDSFFNPKKGGGQ